MDKATQRIAAGLRKAMQAENEGRYFYMMAAQSTQDAKGRETFRDLAREEQEHFEFLKGQLESVVETGQINAGLDLGQAKQFTGSHPIFSAEIQQRVGSAHYEMTALAIGILLERSAVDFYQAEAAAVSDPEIRAFYEKLAEWEQTHLAMLQKQAETLKEDYWHDAHFAPY